MTAEQAAKTALTAVQPLLVSKSPVPLESLTGWVLVYSAAYRFQAGLVYKNGAVQPQQVRIQPNKAATTKPSGTPTTNYVAPICVTVTVCGYAGDTPSTCQTDIYCGGTGGDDGDNGSTDFPDGNNIIDAPATVQQTNPTLGNYGAKLSIKPNAYQVINVTIELDTNAKDLKKIVVTLNGVSWFTKITQIGDGTLTNYNAATNTYSFHVNFQKYLGGYFSSQKTIYGTISLRGSVGTLTIP